MHMIRHALSLRPSGLMVEEKLAISAISSRDCALGMPPRSR